MQYRNIACITRANNDFVVLPVKNCSDPKPATEQACRISACSPEWFTSDWSTVKYPEFKNNFIRNFFLSQLFFTFRMPELYNFYVFCLPQCSATCGTGVQTRLVRCIVEGISTTSCSEINKPSAVQQCNVEPCKKEVSVANKPPKSKWKNLYLLFFSKLKQLQFYIAFLKNYSTDR